MCAESQHRDDRPAAVAQFRTIDVLCGLSGLAIVVFHVRVDLWVGWREISAHPLHYGLFDRVAACLALPTVFLGEAVMMFFILSGFCIHWPHAVSRKKPVLKTYARRRFFRIYPPYLVALLLSIGIDVAVQRIAGGPGSAWSKYVESIGMVQNYTASPGQVRSNPPLWSLPVEVEL